MEGAPWNDEECPLCYGPLENNRFRGNLLESRCGHRFHGACFLEWLPRGSDGCPVCQRPLVEVEPGLHGARIELMLNYRPQRMEVEEEEWVEPEPLTFFQMMMMGMPIVLPFLVVLLLTIILIILCIVCAYVLSS